MGKELRIPAQPAGHADSNLHYLTHGRIALPLEDLLDGIGEFAGIISPDGTLVYSNAQWRALAEEHDFFDAGHPLTCLNRMASKGSKNAKAVWEAFDAVLSGERDEASADFIPAGNPDARYSLKAYRMGRGPKNFVYVTGSDTSEIMELRRSRRQLRTAVLHAQEHERKRIGRELHDSTLQLLVGLQLNLARLKLGAGGDSRWAELLGDCDEVLELAYKEIRGLSYLYHPPAMGEQGLAKALEALAAGFAKRTGLTIEREWSDLKLSSPLAEIALYRFAQEALTNIFRHAEATVVKMRLCVTRKCLHLVIEDNGIGFVPSFQDKTVLGVGVTGMAERMRELGGRVTAFAGNPGIVLIASVPLPSEA